MPCFSPTAFERLQQLFANITPNPASRATVVCPDSFCQIIYKGTALLAGTQPYFVQACPSGTWPWLGTVCPPMCGNTRSWCTSARPAIPLVPSFCGRNGENLFALCDQYSFVIAPDECCSEIYFRSEAPLGGLEAAVKLGRNDLRNLLMFSIEDSCCIGTRSRIVEGVIAEENSAISMGVYTGQAPRFTTVKPVKSCTVWHRPDRWPSVAIFPARMVNTASIAQSSSSGPMPKPVPRPA